MSEYRVHRFDLRMTKDDRNLERFLNSLEGDVVSVVPNVTMKAFWVHVINFVYVVERVPDAAPDRVVDSGFDTALPSPSSSSPSSRDIAERAPVAGSRT